MAVNERELRVDRRIAALEQKVFGTQNPEGDMNMVLDEDRSLDVSETAAPDGGPRTDRQPDTRLDLNDASAADIAEAVDGIGEQYAADLIQERAERGPFRSLIDVAERVDGISLDMLEDAAEAVTVRGED